MSKAPGPPLRRALIMFVLVISGEVIFLLPFGFPRIFRPTILDVFQITNTELGLAFSMYGLLAILAYLGGGLLADRFPARTLLTIALLLTAALGFVFTTIPSFKMLVLIYGCWGITTILLFWSAMLRSVRVWGGKDRQGWAYGLLDGGRGLGAALLASISVGLLAMYLPEDVSSADIEQRTQALRKIIIIFCGITILSGVLVWLIIPRRHASGSTEESDRIVWSQAGSAVRNPALWYQAAIVVCAYVGYKSTDDFSLYARDVLEYDDVAAARIGTLTFWVRPVAAVLAGLLADRVSASKVVLGGFLIMGTGTLLLSSGVIGPGREWLLLISIVYSGLGIYALRGVYFALTAEAQIPVSVTGTAIGIVSMVGFLPDVFFGPVMGYLLDASPGAAGHNDVFAMVSMFAIVGVIVTLLYMRTVRSQTSQA